MHNSLTIALLQARETAMTFFRPIIKQHNLTEQQWRIVRVLAEHPSMDFHDLASDSLLHISTVIVVCEAFLRITPHFGLWLKTFEVKPKMIEGQHAACGGASIRKMTGAAWPKGSIPEVSELWQRVWFYITAPRSAKWAAAPVFRSGPPPQLMSWSSRGLS